VKSNSPIAEAVTCDRIRTVPLRHGRSNTELSCEAPNAGFVSFNSLFCGLVDSPSGLPFTKVHSLLRGTGTPHQHDDCLMV
jgi:hypothetical protein